jgi:hypothetical protein
MPTIQIKLSKDNMIELKPELENLIKSTKQGSLSQELLNAVIKNLSRYIK